ncbi:multicopper oxidase domain-containing protein [Xylanimonas sp. McL0601]|uniref:multicopper oxidase domain-containing protein n=1 Tax=Xylanimonas sp. McL0601 TaxID=3414739 RepID=UPI003CEFB0F1
MSLTLQPPPSDKRRPGAQSSVLHTIGTAVAFGLLVGFVIIALVRPTAATASAHESGSGTESVAEAAGPVTFDIELGDLYVKPAAIAVPAGAQVTLNVTNAGSMEHTLALGGNNPATVKPGGSAVVKWAPLTESTQAWCTVPGHKDAGMILDVNVTGGHAGDSATQADAGGSSAAAAEPADAKIDPTAEPAADWKPYDATLKPAPGGTTHEVTLHVTEKNIEVAPGVKQQLWTYNGTAPGPVLRGKVGDIFKVTVVNDASMQHSIDFHASKVAPNVQMRPIDPGKSLVYQFKAEYAGAFAYHCGVAPMIQHMGNGMFGAVIIDPPGLPKVDKEFVFIQSELNLGPQGKPMDLSKMMSGQNDAVVFNGYYNQYVHAPLHVEPTDRVRAWVVNMAVNEDLAFHVVGSIFDTVWKEGAYTLRRDNPEHGGSQALDLGSTQGGFVEFTLETPGTYTFVGHQMRNLSRGDAGLIVSGDGGEGSAH